MLFDRDKYGIWRIGNELAAAICKATLKGSHLTLKYTEGIDIAQSSDTQYTVSMLPRQTLEPVTIDTTVDNLFDMNFKWNTSGGSLIVSNSIIQIL